MVVHHDLQTVEDYFDHVLFLNRTVIEHGKTADIFTEKNIAATYGGKYSLDEGSKKNMWSILLNSNTQWVLAQHDDFRGCCRGSWLFVLLETAKSNE